ncbi:murein biosynthesis integral membrane protein MurJ [Candidatus Roizmanbacteria bacterium CG_4_10_14_0_2_um_filter_36_35]|uniref:Probable lipid II flippase MurJ n=4 Tax=Candidatus Roizmaniibacteriota TaxID=1752723 RepID=A0A2M7BVI5_9BACT|nr:MAG: murein biosynthesis integral membrane protein MurJ [Candidatus Roizmanbacteria bacterium CG11_big_fil_rev_8_21_14_0_20_35_14]PIV10570.1 MAG: murein biosynthesis integral membrane protein MurJ [Candidatus Roizmanbacteria bacterium CG03_land_8_20_14_0_80_35_26]PIZ67484.1 MAG: murein biosynthesis integral membrane protein MurJ [Candidatus Roizmanbacteria bacterium CG_4_10_14_0_2_um_filter_36_35]PJC32851.1 MAG: murein biosynthesis integral membrane protein MurJ [Candidatus Roizmanbacteria ba
MERFIRKTSDFIFSQQKSIFSSVMLLSLMIVLTSLSGFLRYRILAGYFNKEQLDIFFASFRIPDLIFEILITGALTTTFIPIYLKYKTNKTELSNNISSIINFILFFLTIFIVIATFFLDRIIPLLTPGYGPEKMEKIIVFSRLLLIGQLPFFVLGNFLTGIGQANKTFFLSALAPIIYNLSIIITTVFFYQTLFLSAPIWGVIVGAFFLFAIQLPILFNSDFSYRLILKKTQGLVEFIRLVIPRAFTIIVAQIDATIDLTLATLLGGGAYTVFYLAQHLQLLPVSVIGIAFGQASLPYLTEIYQEKKIEEFKKIITDSLLNIFFLTIPLALFFIFARTPLIRLFFGGQKFDWDATVQTAVTLSYFSIALPFHAVYYLLTRCFYALMDSKTPFYIGFVSILINTIFSLLFVFYFHLPIWSLAISFSISMIINSTFLFIILWKKISGFNFGFIVSELFKMIFSAFTSGVFSYFFMKLLDGLILDTSFTINVFLLLGFTFSTFILLYLFISWIVDVKEIYLISRLLLKAREYQKKITELYTRYE